MTDFIGEAVELDSDDAKYSTANSEFLIKKYAAFYNNLTKSLKQPIGTVIKSSLSEADFLSSHGSAWLLCNGQSMSGTDLATLTGQATVPDMVNTDNRYLTQSDDDANVFNLSPSDNEYHGHKLLLVTTTGQGTQAFGSNAVNRPLSNRPRQGGDNPFYYGNNESEPTVGQMKTSGESSARPVTCYVNFFIKVDND